MRDTVSLSVVVFISTFLIVSSLTGAVVAQSENDSIEPDAIVESQESIQTVISNASSGDTIQIRSGTYEESIVINKNIELVATDDVILDGKNIDTNIGIKIDAADVRIDGVEVARFSGDGIRVEGGMIEDRTIALKNITARLNGQNNIDMVDSPGNDKVKLYNVNVMNNEQDDGIQLSAENVSVKNSTVNHNNDVGLRVTSDSTDQVRIVNSNFKNNGDNDDNDDTESRYSDGNEDDGIYIGKSKSVIIHDISASNNREAGVDINNAESTSIENVQLTNNDQGISVESDKYLNITDTIAVSNIGEGIEIPTTDAIAGGRTVEMQDITSRQNGNTNIFIGETNDYDSAVVNNINTKSNFDGFGMAVETEKLVATNITAENVNDAGLLVRSGNDGNITIRNSTISGSGDNDDNDDTESRRADGNEDDGIYIGSAKSVIIENVESTNNQESGLELEEIKSINITDIKAGNNNGAGVYVDATDTISGRTIEFIDISAKSNRGDNIFIGDTAGDDTATLSDITVASNLDGFGIEADVESISLEDSKIKTSNYAGLRIEASSDGDVDIRNSVISRNGDNDDSRFEDNQDDGIYIGSAKSISVENVKIISNKETGIEIDSTEAVSGGRSIKITNVTSRANGLEGAWIAGTEDADTTFVNQSTFVDNGENEYDALSLGTDNANVYNSIIKENNAGGVEMLSGVVDGRINGSIIVDNRKAEIFNKGESTVDATNNWWGNASVPPEDEISGDVLVNDPLSAPPDLEDPTSSPEVKIANPRLEPKNVISTGTKSHTLNFTVKNVSTDGKKDNISVVLPEVISIVGDTNISVKEPGANLSSTSVTPVGNEIRFALNPSGDNETREYTVNIDLELSAADEFSTG